MPFLGERGQNVGKTHRCPGPWALRVVVRLPPGPALSGFGADESVMLLPDSLGPAAKV